MTRRYRTALLRSAKAAAELEAARIEMQLACEHRRVAEYPYRPDPYGHNHTPPYRVCADCGFAEYGWDCGWKILVAAPTVATAKRAGPIHHNGRLVRVGNERNRQRLFEAAVRGEPWTDGD